MNKVTKEIIAIKTEVRERNWEMLVHECQQSELSVKAWCEQNGIKASTYYARLRKLREKVCREIVPIEAPKAEAISKIQITSGDIAINLPSDIDHEILRSILVTLKSC